MRRIQSASELFETKLKKAVFSLNNNFIIESLPCPKKLGFYRTLEKRRNVEDLVEHTVRYPCLQRLVNLVICAYTSHVKSFVDATDKILKVFALVYG